jgi:hypothetical protein
VHQRDGLNPDQPHARSERGQRPDPVGMARERRVQIEFWDDPPRGERGEERGHRTCEGGAGDPDLAVDAEPLTEPQPRAGEDGSADRPERALRCNQYEPDQEPRLLDEIPAVLAGARADQDDGCSDGRAPEDEQQDKRG